MRINRYIAQATGMSRRAADQAIAAGKVTINGQPAQLGSTITDADTVTLDKRAITPAVKTMTVMLNKPVGYVCSRDGQGSRTVYDLLPPELHQLKPVGRLDKDSSGLLLLTNDGQLAHQLTHPGFQKRKIYHVTLDKPLSADDQSRTKEGIELEDGPSFMQLKGRGSSWQVTLYEGRNRQIRRSFEALGYTVTKLHRTQFGPYKLKNLTSGQVSEVLA